MKLQYIKGKPVIRCSSLDQFLSCHGSRALLEAIGGGVRADDSDSWEGSWCHYEAARRLVEEHGAIPPAYGLIKPYIPADFEPSTYAHWYVDFYLREVLASAGAERAIEVSAMLLTEGWDQDAWTASCACALPRFAPSIRRWPHF